MCEKIKSESHSVICWQKVIYVMYEYVKVKKKKLSMFHRSQSQWNTLKKDLSILSGAVWLGLLQLHCECLYRICCCL